MRKIVLGGLALASLAAIAMLIAPATGAQQRDGNVQPFPDSILSLVGPGSTIGVTVRDQTSDPAGVLIEDVREGTPARRAGLEKGDVVVEFDNEPVRSVRQFTRVVRETAPGRAVKMTVLRGGSRRTVDITPETRDSVTMQQFPRITGDAFRALPRDFDFDPQFFLGEGFYGSQRRLGVSVVALSEQLAMYFGVKDGVLVSEVRENTPAASAGLKAGDVITAANGRTVLSSAELMREVRDAEPGSTLELRLTRDRKEITAKVMLPQQQRRSRALGTQPI